MINAATMLLANIDGGLVSSLRHFCHLAALLCMQAVVNLDNVKSVPGLGKVTELPFVTQVLQGILPTIGEFCSGSYCAVML